MKKRVLLPIHSFAQAKRVLRSAAQLVSTLRAELTLMRVLDPFRDGGPKPLTAEMEELVPELQDVPGVRCHVDAHTDPVRSIALYAEQNDIDMIVVPRLRTGLFPAFSKPWTMTRRLIAEGPCPVWVLGGERENYGLIQPVRRVLCAVSGKDIHVLRSAAAYCESLNARLFLLHVVPDVHEGSLLAAFDKHVVLSAERGITMLAEMQKLAGTDAVPLIEIGNVTDTIRRTVNALNIDLVISGRPGTHHRQRRWLQSCSSAPAPWTLPCQALAV